MISALDTYDSHLIKNFHNKIMNFTFSSTLVGEFDLDRWNRQ